MIFFLRTINFITYDRYLFSKIFLVFASTLKKWKIFCASHIYLFSSIILFILICTKRQFLLTFKNGGFLVSFSVKNVKKFWELLKRWWNEMVRNDCNAVSTIALFWYFLFHLYDECWYGMIDGTKLNNGRKYTKKKTAEYSAV